VEFRDRIKDFRRVPASSLRNNPQNWRTHPQHQLDAIAGILAEVGFAGAELARELPDGTLELIDGHARASVAGDAVVPVLVLDVTEQEAHKLLRAFDPISAMATADAAKLKALDNIVTFSDATLMAMQDNVRIAANLARDVDEANRILGDAQGSGESPETYATEPQERKQTLFPLSIVIDRTSKERWDFYKETIGVTKDSEAFTRLLESIP